MLKKFLISRISGWLAIIITVLSTTAGGALIYHYKELQKDAAYCKGRLEALEEVDTVRERAIDYIEADKDEIIDEIKELKDTAEAEREALAPSLEGVTGCAAERAPESILRYHGRGVRE